MTKIRFIHLPLHDVNGNVAPESVQIPVKVYENGNVALMNRADTLMGYVFLGEVVKEK